MSNIYIPDKEFKTRKEVEVYMSLSGTEKWEKDKALSEYFDQECYFLNNWMLLVPRGKKDRIRGNACLYADYIALKNDIFEPYEPIESPFLYGFKDYLKKPEQISDLALAFTESLGIPSKDGWMNVLKDLDKWVHGVYDEGNSYDTFLRNDIVCGVCAVTGEAVREKIKNRNLKWIVQEEYDDFSHRNLYVANLIDKNHHIMEISQYLFKQLVDPDNSTTKTILRTFLKTSQYINKCDIE